MKQTLVLFAYNERDALFTSNLHYFLNNGVFESEQCDFCIIVNGESSQTIAGNVGANCCVLHRANRHGDFGAWGFALDTLGTDYESFIFLNDTARGPYVPGWAARSDWVRHFTRRLSDACKLVGPTKNSMIAEHLQSYAFALDKTALELLLKERIFHPSLHYPAQKMQFIVAHEVRMSKLLRDAGFCVEQFYYPPPGHGLTPYFTGTPLSPFEVMFVKTNTGMHFDQRQLSVGHESDKLPPQLRHGGGAARTTRDRSHDKNVTTVARSKLQRK